MPDMQTALKEALNEWDDSLGRHQVEKQQPTPLPEVTQMQVTHNPRGQRPTPENESARRELFYHIKGNPESSLQDLADCGFDHGTTSTHLSTLYFNGKLLRKQIKAQRRIHGGVLTMRDVFVYSVGVPEYDDIPAVVPNKKAKKIRIHKKGKHVDAAPQAHGIAALPVEKTKEESERIGRPTHTRIPRPPMETFIAPQPEAVKPPRIALTASYVIDNISLSEAVLLHAELKKMLG
jgi:hypothetical protein